jgi:D-alanyl-D-alanine carboxypeptidase (penicillin-binding protein 5/6)
MERMMRSSVKLVVLAAAAIALGAQAAEVQPQSTGPASSLGIPYSAPEINARSAVVLDAATGTVLFGKNPDLVVPPASLAKLMTLHVVYEEIEAGRLAREELLTIDRRDCSPYVPLGSSLMYLQPGMKVSVIDLMRGAAVVSGNDATFALARRISGSNEAFAQRMNASASALGFSSLRFVEPSGLSELNAVNAREFALFCKSYIDLHPEALAELHSLRHIEFPRPEHATPEYRPEGRIVQSNRNSLIEEYEGCDGLKTGYIIESGYNLAATARRGDTRFIVVTLGGTGDGPDEGPGAGGTVASRAGGAAQRSSDGAALLDWAFDSFVSLAPAVELKPLRSWYGEERELRLVPTSSLAVTLPRSKAKALVTRVEAPTSVVAPIAAGSKIGEVVFSSEGRVFRRVDLVAEREVRRGNILVLIRDLFLRLADRLFGSRLRKPGA